MVVPLRTAQALFDQASLTRVDVGLAAGASAAEVVAGLESRLLVEPYVITSPQDLADGLRASTADFQSTTALIAAIALFAGAFLIVNTLSMTVARADPRRRAAARRRRDPRPGASGSSSSRPSSSGVLGSLLGLALGAVLAALMAAWLRTVGSVTARVGRAARSAPSWSRSRRAWPSRSPPRSSPPSARRASRRSRPSAPGWTRRPPVARGCAGCWSSSSVVGLAGLLVWPRDAGAAGAVRALAVYGVLLVATLLVPFLVPALARIGGLPFRLPFALEERLARATIVRDRSRTTLTLGALAVGLALDRRPRRRRPARPGGRGRVGRRGRAGRARS